MVRELSPVTTLDERCRCCGSSATLFGVVDFNKAGEGAPYQLFGLAGVPIYYHRCDLCKFIFTTAFDKFTHEDFLHHIYNADYVRVDPSYVLERPVNCAKVISNLFPDEKPRAVLDYGGGEGLLAELLRKGGFPLVDTYDPFVPRFSERPTRKYDLVVAFEVIEHVPDQRALLFDLDNLAAEESLILFSTAIQPPNIETIGANWWYVSPRSGHVSVHTSESLERLAGPFGYNLGSFQDTLHVLFRKVPEFAKELIDIK